MAKIYKQITDLIGKTPLVELGKYSASKGLETPVIAKVEFFNPGGSVKDRIALAMIEDAEQKGILKPGATIIEPVPEGCHDRCAAPLAHFQSTYAVADHCEDSFIVLSLTSLHQKERILIRFLLYSDIGIICGTIFHVPFPAFSAVFVFDFKKHHFLLFVQQNAPDHGQ